MVAELEKRLKATPRAARPLDHAALRYSVGLAYAELPTGDRGINLSRAVASYREAAAIFVADRFPVEHARVQNALGAALRDIGEAEEATRALTHAVELLAPGQVPGELGAALNNLGLARSDLDEHPGAIEVLRRAVDIFAAIGDVRQRAISMHNLGQVLAKSGDHLAAADTYARAIAETDPEELPYQWGLLNHALGVSLTARNESRRAAEAFINSLKVFTRQRYPFQCALAKNNLGLACAQIGDVTSLRRAVAAYEDALRLLDPRLHREQWEQAYRNLELAEAALGDLGLGSTRAEHFVALAAEVEEEERALIMRERLTELLGLPEPRRTEALGELDLAAVHLPEDGGRRVTAAWLHVLMELPNDLLVAGLGARLAAHGHLLDDGDRERAEDVLEWAIQNELLAPQRIRVRDTLEMMGYERR